MKYIYILIGITIWFIIGFVFVYRQEIKRMEWFRWVGHSLTYRKKVKTFKANLNKLTPADQVLHLVDLLDNDFWYKKYWFGRKFEGVIIEELEKLSK